MRARLWFALHVLTALLAAGAAVAEPIGSHFQLTPFGGYTMFDPKLRYPSSNAPLSDDLYVGGRLGWESKSWIGLEAAAGMTPTVEDMVVGGADFDWMHASGNLVLSPARGRWGNPYAFVGAGYTQLKPASGEKRSTNTFEFGGGVKLWMTDAVGLRFEARDVSFKPLENLSGQKHFHNMVLGAGLTFALGATPRDTDGDGVPDRKDKCPATPKGATVNATGCPSDTDGDGVLDGLDKCPGTPKGATVDANGCPSDADGDGVFDGIDACADTPKGATVDAKGCPSDSDNDGVLDGLDACPNTPAGAKVDAKGCPTDADGDGVFDGLDECADTPAGLKVDAKGCPIEVMERETELLDTGLIRLNDVNFETGKAEIMPESYATLDAAGAVMLKWPQLRIEIGGHTDSRGGVARNKVLSEARADSVRAYILRKFPALSPSQFSTKGYGPTRPVAPNTNALNMAKNRRVEFVVLNKEVLKKEVERRRLLRQNEGTPADSSATPK
ncbi:MAG: OmpA family protein [Candidatus Eisenbacteria bacterium]|uniref:OmpA family protein n=1 Tax=Eiseniibacteriota bacterium TaxID=2212470 RepID=A0A933WAK3_UNCEI|nr:OmpA family protein [Candidatus Eisenbacteria bacterium]